MVIGVGMVMVNIPFISHPSASPLYIMAKVVYFLVKKTIDATYVLLRYRHPLARTLNMPNLVTR